MPLPSLGPIPFVAWITVAAVLTASVIILPVVLTLPETYSCSQQDAGNYYVKLIDPPQLNVSKPPIVCPYYSDQTVELDGTNFLIWNSQNPTVMLDGRNLTMTSIKMCSDFNVRKQSAQLCNQTFVIIPQMNVTTAYHPNLTLTLAPPVPPHPAATTKGGPCFSSHTDLLTIVPPPLLYTIEPRVICNGTTTEMQLSGANFLSLTAAKDVTLPKITINEKFTVNQGSIRLADCQTINVKGYTVSSCATVYFNVTAADHQDLNNVTVTNPAPADCISTSTIQFGVINTPIVQQVVPEALCSQDSSNTTLTLTGSTFILAKGSQPIVSFAGQEWNYTISNCNNHTLFEQIQVCQTITIENVVPSSLPTGDLAITVINPDLYGCATTSTQVLYNAEVPTVADVNPRTICAGSGTSTIQIAGTGFAYITKVELIRDCSTNPDPNCPTSYNGTVIDVTNDTMHVQFPQGGVMIPDYYYVKVANTDTCFAPPTIRVHVKPIVLPLFVDPPTVYTGINVQVTVYVTGLDALPQSVSLLNPSFGNNSLSIFNSTNFNKVYALIPGGLQAGTYDVEIVSIDGCIGDLGGQVALTSTININIDSIDPSYIWTSTGSDVTITCNSTSAQFEQIPRVYLSPSNSSSLAVSIPSVGFINSQTLSCSIPSGLNPGPYDVIVVNPSGSVGFVSQGIIITQDAPPSIDTISPLYYSPQAAQSGTIIGSMFVTGATLSTLCIQPTGVKTVVTTQTTFVSSTQLTAVWDFSIAPQGSICTVRVTNPDGSTYLFSAISTKSPSGNLFGFLSHQTLAEGRRGHGMVVGRVTNTNRQMYVIGGDTGAKTSPLNMVERSQMDSYGNLGSFSLTPLNYLSVNKTFAGVITVGRYIYVIGGHNGVSATQTVHRARILNPSEVPQISIDVNILTGAATSNLTAGFWVWSVSALFPANDPSNPNGQSLPSAVMPVQLPGIADKLQMVLSWKPVSGASAYNVYRTPLANATMANMQLVATVTGLTFTDGGASPISTQAPLSQGDLGQWDSINVPALTTAREGLSVSAAVSPVDPNIHYIYAWFGRDASGNYLNTFEVLTVNTSLSDHQVIAGWTTYTAQVGTTALSARADGGVMTVVNSDITTVIGTNTDFIIAGGQTGTGSEQALNSATVNNDGSVTIVNTNCNGKICTSSTPGVGFCAIQSTGIAYLLGGGSTAAPNNGGVSNAITTLPNFAGNFNNLGGGGQMSSARIYFACTYDSARIFVSGGWTGTAVSNTLDSSAQ